MAVGILPSEWEMIGRLFLALGVGAIIGLERELRGVPAGLRTNALVCIGATLFTLSSLVLNVEGADPTRIAAQVAVGIGFLGGGTIFKQNNQVQGLTTAANMWVLAAIGLLIGFGQYTLSVFAAFLVLFLLVFGKFWERKSLGKYHFH